MAPPIPSTTRTARIASRYSVRQSSSVAGTAAGSSFRTSGSPRSSQPAARRSARIGGSTAFATSRSTNNVSGAPERGEAGRQHAPRRFSSPKNSLGRPANRPPPHLRVQHDLARLLGVGGGVDVGVAEAFQMGDDRDAALALHAFDQRGAPPR